MTNKVIYWFRQDLRLGDNPALVQAAKSGDVFPIYILDDENAGEHKMGGASRWWLHHSLNSLNESIDGKLNFYIGKADIILPKIAKEHNAKAVYWNNCYEPWRIKRDANIKEILKKDNIEVESFNGSLLWEPLDVKKDDGTPYRVFTPFYRKGCVKAQAPRHPLAKPQISCFISDKNSIRLNDLKLLPEIKWYKQLEPHWEIGEKAAKKVLDIFLKTGISNYKEGRNFPAKKNVSRLSTYLHFGEISPNQVWWAAKNLGDDNNTDTFCSELGWREFSHHLLYHFPELPNKNLQPKFDQFPWNDNKNFLQRWQTGQTGYPIVDAGMRELWQTGYMHNRVRMIVGSFLVKNLLLDWRHGERWFWDCLVDADLANNSASWQWVAGCGADATPYFRIFNPITQGQKFDVEGKYTRRYVPELKDIPDKYLFCPWQAPQHILDGAKIQLGKDYPLPIVDVSKSRNIALDAFKKISMSF